uniref:Uncharacterized protein n=1 Tax=Prolemur simus TaxID=1328070 RepID=A0A8C8YG98_PROSS
INGCWSTVVRRSQWNRPSHGFSPDVTSTERTLTTLAKCPLSHIPSDTLYHLSLQIFSAISSPQCLIYHETSMMWHNS